MHCKIIAEIGINHKGDLKTAEDLIAAAKKAGAWAVKFQYRDVESFYESTDEIGDEIISEEIRRIALTADQYEHLRIFAKSLGLSVGISFFRSLDVDRYGRNVANYDFYKIPSAEMLNSELFDCLLSLERPIFVSTGGHSQQDVLNFLPKVENESFVVFHCIANYPVLVGNQNLAFIQTIKDNAKCRVGYSSHDNEWEVCILALAMGAEYIERHITFDKRGGGLDDSTSSTPDEFEKLCLIAANYGKIVGSGIRQVNQGEMINMQNLGTSLYAVNDMSAGELIEFEDLTLKAPRKGLTSHQFRPFDGQPLQQNITQGEPILRSHFAGSSQELPARIVQFANNRSISIPVRLHDFRAITTRVPVQNFELHLSYGEVGRILKDFTELQHFAANGRKFSIHLPDYLEGNRLIDPISHDAAVKVDSDKMIRGVREIAKKLSDDTGANVPIVGSFSQQSEEDKIASLDRVFNYIEDVATEEFRILPQWLPKIAWYFGGAEKLHMFCDEEDIDYIAKHQVPICLDISHLILSANFAAADWWLWYNRMIDFAHHLHLSDAAGVDGEGVRFGSGELANIDQILRVDNRIVLEVWQGHLAQGQGFVEALEYLGELYG